MGILLHFRFIEIFKVDIFLIWAPLTDEITFVFIARITIKSVTPGEMYIMSFYNMFCRIGFFAMLSLLTYQTCQCGIASLLHLQDQVVILFF